MKACLFDLDGVIVDTAKYHFVAWRRLANYLGFDFTKSDNEKLKGVSRADSLDLILGWGGVHKTDAEKQALMALKNDWYLEHIHRMTSVDILPGVLDLIADLEEKGIRIALGSASKNAPLILRQTGLFDRFNAIIDGSMTIQGKPHPEVFLKGAQALGVVPGACIVFEDAAKGIEAALAGGMYAVGIGEPESLGAAHLVIPSLADWTWEKLLAALRIS